MQSAARAEARPVEVSDEVRWRGFERSPLRSAEDRGCVGLERDALAWPWLIVVYAVTIPFGGSFLGSLLFGERQPRPAHPPP